MTCYSVLIFLIIDFNFLNIQPLAMCCKFFLGWNWQIAEDVRERWETSDNPIVHKIQEYAFLP
jgi:hypothetical protein